VLRPALLRQHDQVVDTQNVDDACDRSRMIKIDTEMITALRLWLAYEGKLKDRKRNMITIETGRQCNTIFQQLLTHRVVCGGWRLATLSGDAAMMVAVFTFTVSPVVLSSFDNEEVDHDDDDKDDCDG